MEKMRPTSNNWLAFSLSPWICVGVEDGDPTTMAHHVSFQPSLGFIAPCEWCGMNIEGGPLSFQMLEMPMKSDAPVCMMDASTRAEWQISRLDSSRIGDQARFLTSGLLSLGSSGEDMAVGKPYLPGFHSYPEYQEAPKLENFMSSASLSVPNPEPRNSHQSARFEGHNGASLETNHHQNIGIDVNMPLSSCSSREMPPLSHLLAMPDSSPCSESHEGELGSLALQDNSRGMQYKACHNLNLLNASSGESLFSDSASWQPPEAQVMAGSSNTVGVSALKRLLREHPEAEAEVATSCSSKACALGDLQSSSLSMTHGLLQSNAAAAKQWVAMAGPANGGSRKRYFLNKDKDRDPAHRKSLDTFGQRTSQYRGITRHRWTGRYEAHLWDNSCRTEGQSRKGRQVYLGGYEEEEKAAKAYDLAALKYWGPTTNINFPLSSYTKELEEMKTMTRQEYVVSLRRKSSGFSRGASIYRGVTRHHQHGRWQARIGRIAGNKDLYLGTFSKQEEAAQAYDVAAIKFRGMNAVTNFDVSRYDVERICASSTLLIGELARRHKDAITSDASGDDGHAQEKKCLSVSSHTDNNLMGCQSGEENRVLSLSRKGGEAIEMNWMCN